MRYVRYIVCCAIVIVIAISIKRSVKTSCSLSWDPVSQPLADVVSQTGIVTFPGIVSEDGYVCFVDANGVIAARFQYDRLTSSSFGREDNLTFDYADITSRSGFEAAVMDLGQRFSILKESYDTRDYYFVESSRKSLADQMNDILDNIPIDAAYSGDTSFSKSLVLASDSGAPIYLSLIVSVSSAAEDRVVFRAGITVTSGVVFGATD